MANTSSGGSRRPSGSSTKRKSPISKKIEKGAKKYAKKDSGFIMALVVGLAVGVIAGVVLRKTLTKNDGFELVYDGVAVKEITVTKDEGLTFDSISPSLTGTGADYSQYVKSYIKYEDEEGALFDFTGSKTTEAGKYYIVYYVDGESFSFIDKLKLGKFASEKLKVTVTVEEGGD